MTREVRQRCPLSPLLFNLLMADLKKKMGRMKWGGVRLGEDRVYTLAYADDMVLVTEGENEMRSMIERLEDYLEGTKMELNTDKTK